MLYENGIVVLAPCHDSTPPLNVTFPAHFRVLDGGEAPASQLPTIYFVLNISTLYLASRLWHFVTFPVRPSPRRQGLLDVLPPYLLALLTWRDLELRVCGVPEIDIHELQKTAIYEDLPPGPDCCWDPNACPPPPGDCHADNWSGSCLEAVRVPGAAQFAILRSWQGSWYRPPSWLKSLDVLDVEGPGNCYGHRCCRVSGTCQPVRWQCS